MKIIDLRSDTVTRPSPAMKRAMMAAPVGDDVFGDDPTVNELQETTARLLGKQDGLFLPSGTMGNQAAIKTHTSAGDEVIVDRESHVFRYEAAAASVVSGVQLHALDGQGGIMTAEQVEAAIRPANDLHQPKTTMVCLENTHNRAGGVVYPLEEIESIAKLCRRNGIKTHLDGARLWNASMATEMKLDHMAKPFDSVMVCFSKGLGCPVGSVLVGSREFIDRARRWRKMFGGGMRQAGILAAAGLYALKHNLRRLKDDHRRARRLADIITGIDSVGIDLDSVQTNIVVFDIAGSGLSPDAAAAKLQDKGLLVIPFGRTMLRAVTHLDVGDGDIEAAGGLLRRILRS